MQTPKSKKSGILCLPKQWKCTQKMLEHSNNVCEKILNTKTCLHFYEALQLEYNRNVRFLGRKDLMKVTHSVLEYRVLIRTRHAGIK